VTRHSRVDVLHSSGVLGRPRDIPVCSVSYLLGFQLKSVDPPCPVSELPEIDAIVRSPYSKDWKN